MSNQARKRDEPASIGDVLTAVDALGRAVDRRLSGIEASQEEICTDVGVLKAGQARLETDVTGLKTDVGTLKTDMIDVKAMLVKLMEGQAVLLQNDMELRRRIGPSDQ